MEAGFEPRQTNSAGCVTSGLQLKIASLRSGAAPLTLIRARAGSTHPLRGAGAPPTGPGAHLSGAGRAGAQRPKGSATGAVGGGGGEGRPEGGARGSARGRVSKECRPWPGTPASRLPAAAGEALSHGEAPAPRPARCLRALGPALAPAPPLGLPPPPPPREYPGARGVGRGRGAGHQGAAARLAQPALDA